MVAGSAVNHQTQQLLQMQLRSLLKIGLCVPKWAESPVSWDLRDLTEQELMASLLRQPKECFGKAGVISTADSKIKAIVMPTDEEKMIALTTKKIVFDK